MSMNTTVTWNKDYNPQLISKRIEESKRTDDVGKVSFSGFKHNELTILLYSTLIFPTSVPEIEARGIINQATFNVGQKMEVSAEALLTEINRLTGEYLERMPEPFVLASSISVEKSTQLPSLRMKGTSILFPGQLPSRYFEEKEKLSRRVKDYLFGEPPTNYRPLMARVSARSIYEAVDCALDAIDLARGIWNWFLNRSQATRMSIGPNQPINRLLLGPIHTLHQPLGKLAADGFWFERTYRAPARLMDLRGNIEKAEEFRRVVLGKLRRIGYQLQLRDAIVRYCRALDDRDWNVSFLRLWGVLELLTHAANQATTVERAAFVFTDREYQMQVLRHLRSHRNRAVHAGISIEEMETPLYQLKYCVEALLEFHLGNGQRFSSLEEAASFLSLPTDSTALRRRANMAQFALKFRGYRKT